MSQPLQITVREQQDGLVVELSGDIDLSTVPKLKSALARELEQGAERFYILMQSVGHVDSTGLGMLVWLQKRVDKAGVVLVQVAPHLRKLLTLTGLEPLFSYAESL